MAQITRLSRLVSGIQRQVDLSANTLVVSDLMVGGTSGTSLSKAILDRLINLQNGTELTDRTYHYHDDTTSVYTRLDASKKDIQATSDDVGSAINDLDDNKISKTGSIAFTGDQSMGSHKLTNLTAGSVSSDAVNYGQTVVTSGANAFAGDQSMGSHKLTNVAAGTAATDAIQKQQAVLVDGSQAFTGDQSMGSHKLTNLAAPTLGTDATNKSYVDNLAQGLSWKGVVRSATTGALPSYTGTGTLTASANGALPAQDGVTLVVNDRLLVKNEATAARNGIYVVTQVGDASNPFILTRATDADTATELQWATLEVSADAVTQTGYIFRESDDITTLETDAVAFTILSHGLDWNFSNGLNVSGNTVTILAADTSINVSSSGVKVNLATTSGLAVSSGLKVNPDGTSIDINGSNQVEIAALGVTSAKIAADAVDDTKVKLRNNQAFRARNAANLADVNLFHLDTSNVMQFDLLPQANFTPSAASDLANKAYVDSKTASTLQTPEVAGQSFAANTTFAVRWGIPANAETATRLYKADLDATSTDNFHVVGFVQPSGAVSAGGSITLYTFGQLTQGSGDTAFATNDQGKPLYLQASGAFSTTAPTTTNQASVIVGYVKSTTVIDIKSVQIQGVN